MLWIAKIKQPEWVAMALLHLEFTKCTTHLQCTSFIDISVWLMSGQWTLMNQWTIAQVRDIWPIWSLVKGQEIMWSMTAGVFLRQKYSIIQVLAILCPQINHFNCKCMCRVHRILIFGLALTQLRWMKVWSLHNFALEMIDHFLLCWSQVSPKGKI